MTLCLCVFICIYDVCVLVCACLLARTCTEWATKGLTVSTMADIDPDGTTGGLSSIRVYCDLAAQGGIGVTVIGTRSQRLLPSLPPSFIASLPSLSSPTAPFSYILSLSLSVNSLYLLCFTL